jgi:hypothetical protein
MLYELFKQLGSNYKSNPYMISKILPQIYSISLSLKTPEVKLCNLFIKDFDHAALTHSNLSEDYLFLINATSSSKIHGSECFKGSVLALSPLKIESGVEISNKLIKNGFFSVSYSHKNHILSADNNPIIKKILINCGLTHECDIGRVYNAMLSYYKLNYINNIILNKNNSIILNDYGSTYTLKNNAYREFMRTHDKNNDLLGLDNCYKDDDFVEGFNIVYNVLGQDFVISLSYYGNEGLDYFIQENDFTRYLSNIG